MLGLSRVGAAADERCLLLAASNIAASALLLSMSAWCSPAATAAAHAAFRQRLDPVRAPGNGQGIRVLSLTKTPQPSAPKAFKV